MASGTVWTRVPARAGNDSCNRDAMDGVDFRDSQRAFSQRVSAARSLHGPATAGAGPCALQWMLRGGLRAARSAPSRALRLFLAAVLAASVGAPRPAAAAAPGAMPASAPSGFCPPLAHAPLDPPLTITGGFGEYRVGHFHAGVDLGTGGRVGKPVYAPLPGHVERVRASGVGYGRSIYIRARDGRLLQLGHLDAFEEPLASWVAAVQESSGQYEQDLWPDASRFPVRAGQRVAWSGQSGAGGPHVHFEIRRGDMALNPLRAGLRVADRLPPTLVSLTLQPLDDTTRVGGQESPGSVQSLAPYTIGLLAPVESVYVSGRVRAVVGARDGTWRGVDRMVPWSVEEEWDGRHVTCRFDSISWATDMPECDYVYDAGRVVGDRGIVLWAPARFRPRVIVADASFDEAAGTITVHRGDPPRRLTLIARDLGGNTVKRRVVLTPWDRARGSGPLLRPRGPHESEFTAGEIEHARFAHLVAFDVVPVSEQGLPAFRWTVPRDGLFEPAVFLAESLGATRGTRELVPLGMAYALHPFMTPMRGAMRVGIRLPAQPVPRGVALYRDQGDGWEWVGTAFDSATNRIGGESRRLGAFALFADTLGPRIAPLAPAAHAASAPYNRWALEARLTEEGSGVDARASGFEADGVRVPSEWDAEERTLRWRPHHAPSKGRHRFTVVAHDRAGNVALRSGTFVLD